MVYFQFKNGASLNEEHGQWWILSNYLRKLHWKLNSDLQKYENTVSIHTYSTRISLKLV